MSRLGLELETDEERAGRDATVVAQRAVLGACLHSLRAVERVSAILDREDFLTEGHQHIWDAITYVYEHADGSDPAIPDHVVVARRMHEVGQLNAVGGTQALLDMYTDVATTSNVLHYARQVADAAADRRIETLGLTLAQGGRAGLDRETRDALVVEAQAVLEDVAGGTQQGVDPTAALGEETLAEVVATLETPTTTPRVRTGLFDVDKYALGWGPGQLIVAAGRPGAGKSVFGQHCLEHVAKTVGPTFLVTMEMSRAEVEARRLAAICDIPSQRANLASPAMTDEDWKLVAERWDELASAPIHVNDEEKMSPARLSALIGQLKRREPDLALVVVDYLGLMDADERYSNEQEKVASISKALKRIAKKHQVPILALHQLNRKNTERADKRPEMSDLRSSGAVEQDANQVILLHREDQYQAETPLAGEMEIHVAKHRGGPTGRGSVAAQLHSYRLANMGPAPVEHDNDAASTAHN